MIAWFFSISGDGKTHGYAILARVSASKLSATVCTSSNHIKMKCPHIRPIDSG